ncbi:amidase [Sulfitobacter sp. F26169L]|uniref:amidase n=1 Tax=Sulfitobacter sp. F26169L TaxID=2996015 RepID=UPI002260F227|nr:amidase [Sulfitobacter sp. F26169L]MCX7565270.1 amidase [Sulfitobacter sp. F26169L]
MDILKMDALAQSGALESGAVSAVELMEATLARIAAVNPRVNAVVSLSDGDRLLAQARAADNAPRSGWLHGMPIAIKDLANAAGFPTSRGSPLYAGQVAEADDQMVARLRAAGAIIIGKTNTPEFGLGSHTFNPVHGATRNPYDVSRSAGGSSGGAAAALATGMLAVADGSDMMGSLRNPAGWNNIYGMRPSWGTVPADPEGDMFMHQLATSGPMARSPADLAALLDVMTGIDPRHPLSTDSPATLPHIDRAPKNLRIGWLGDWDGAFPYEDGITGISQAAMVQLEELGHRTEALNAPFDADAIWQSWIDLRSFAVAAGLSADYADEARRACLKPAALWEVERGFAMSAQEVQRASNIRSDWFRRATRLFESHDVLVLPSAQLWPFDVSWTNPVEIAGQAMDTYHRWMQVVVPAGLIGLPVVNVPVGFGANGLPAGIQLIGPRGSDGALLQLAQQWHGATHWPQQRPPKA